MGVKQLWKALEEAKTLVGIEHLRNKTVAVDTTGWLIQSERTGELQHKSGIKAHLRNLFWRIHLLQRHHVRAVFVLEGSAPEMKQATLKKRAEQSAKFYSQQEPACDDSSELSECPSEDDDAASTSGTRQRGHGQRTQECCELLDCLGVPYIRAQGEAEATCALLNKSGLVDSVMSDDGDSFLFGARQVYKNFSKGSADDGSIEFYDMSDIEAKLNLNREKLVAMALLTGCDYDAEGVKGIGKEQSLKLLRNFPSDNVLQRLRGWKSEDCDLNQLEHAELKKPSHCQKCNHPGTKTTHQNAERSLELRLRKKALQNPDFPDEKIIKEFLDDPDPDPVWKDLIQWRRPDFMKLKEFLSSKLGWDDTQAVRRALPLMTAWDMETTIKTLQERASEPTLTPEAGSGSAETGSCHTVPDVIESKSVPERILHARTSKKVQVLDVQWKKIDGVPEKFFKMSIPVSPTKADENLPGVTEEFRSDVEAAFPWLVKFFDIERAPTKGKRKSSVKDSTSTKQLRLTKIFQVRKRLNFVGADKDPPGPPGEQSRASRRTRSKEDTSRNVPDIDCQQSDTCPKTGLQETFLSGAVNSPVDQA